MQGRVGESESTIDRQLDSLVMAVAVTNQSGCVMFFQSETIANPVRGVRAWLPWQLSSLNVAGVGSCCLATNSTGVTAPATESNARR